MADRNKLKLSDITIKVRGGPGSYDQTSVTPTVNVGDVNKTEIRQRMKDLATVRREMEKILPGSSELSGKLVEGNTSFDALSPQNKAGLIRFDNVRKDIIQRAYTDGCCYEVEERYLIPEGNPAITTTPAPGGATTTTFNFDAADVIFEDLITNKQTTIPRSKCSVFKVTDDTTDELRNLIGEDQNNDIPFVRIMSQGNNATTLEQTTNATFEELKVLATTGGGGNVLIANGASVILKSTAPDNHVKGEFSLIEEASTITGEPPKRYLVRKRSICGIVECGGKFPQEEVKLVSRKKDGSIEDDDFSMRGFQAVKDPLQQQQDDAIDPNAQKVIPKEPELPEKPVGTKINYRNIAESCISLVAHISDKCFDDEADKRSDDLIAKEIMNDIYAKVLAPHFISQTAPELAYSEYSKINTFDEFIKYVETKKTDRIEGNEMSDMEKIYEMYIAMKDEVALSYRKCKEMYNDSIQQNDDEITSGISESEVKNAFIKSVTDLILPKVVEFDTSYTPIDHKSVDGINDKMKSEEVKERIEKGIQKSLDDVINDQKLTVYSRTSIASNLIHTKIMSMVMKVGDRGEENELLSPNERRTISDDSTNTEGTLQSVSKYSDGMTAEEINKKTDNALERLVKANKASIPVKIAEDITRKGERTIRFERFKPPGRPSSFRLILKEPFAKKFNMVTLYENVNCQTGLIDGIRRTCEELKTRGIATESEIFESMEFNVKGCSRLEDMENFFRKNYSSEPAEDEAGRGVPFQKYNYSGGEEGVKSFLESVVETKKTRRSGPNLGC
jgi:hypothetical protein